MSDREENRAASPAPESRKDTSIVTESGKSDSKGDKAKPSASPRRPASQGDGKKKQKEFFKEELKRLKKSLKKESEKINQPAIREHIPYVFNSLGPYYNVSSASYLIELKEQNRPGYISRQTAISLCDPWEDLQLDKETYLPRVDSAKAVINTEQTKPKDQKERPPKEGSTRLPKFPAVRIPADDLGKKTLYYSDVPSLRNELRKKYSSTASEKTQNDYIRTKQDFFRMELDRLESYHPSVRPHMKSTYYAYLQNTPGSRRAVTECVGSLEKESARDKEPSQPQQQAAN